jgi:hypothetical protein
MAYRRTERVLQHLAGRHDAIVAAARSRSSRSCLGLTGARLGELFDVAHCAEPVGAVS